MASVELVLRLILAAMFLVAAGGKLADLEASRDTVEAFGLPRRLAALGGTLLPIAEVLTALALLPTATARWGSLAAALLLATFTGGVAYALSQGRTPDCNCFGVVSSEQISNRTIGRNVVLIALAAVSAWRAPGSSLTSWTTSTSAGDLVATLAVLGLALALVLYTQTRHQLSEMRFDLASAQQRQTKPGLQPGDLAPEFELLTLADNRRQTFEELRERQLPTLLVFATQTCGPCTAMLPELVRWNETMHETVSFVLIEAGVDEPEELAAHIAHHGELLTLVDNQRSVTEAYEVTATPTAVLVGADGRIAAPQSMGAGNIEGLVRTALDLAPAPTAA
jgi:uncharacterized membrane protein YphA (DoxX/SURF4 family)/peroxiredoxin